MTRLKEFSLLLPLSLFLIILPFPGTVAARLLLLLVSFLIAAWYWWQSRKGFPAIPGKQVIMIWAGVCALSYFYAIDPAYTLGEIKNEIGYAMMAFFSFFVLSNTDHRLRMLLGALLIGFLVIGIWGVATWFAGGLSWNEAGRHGGSGVFATYLVTVLPALALLTGIQSSSTLRLATVAAIALLLVLVFATGQRALWPTLAVQGLLYWWYLLVRRSSNPKDRSRNLVILAVIVGFAITGLTMGHTKRFGPAGEQLGDDVRLEFWPKVVEVISDNPATGAGLGRRAFAKAYPEMIPEQNTLLWHAHNVFLNYGLSMGIPGIVALLALFAWWAWFFRNAASGSGVAALAGLAGLVLVTGVVMRNQFNDFFARDMALLFWALTGMFARQAMTGNSTGNRS